MSRMLSHACSLALIEGGADFERKGDDQIYTRAAIGGSCGCGGGGSCTACLPDPSYGPGESYGKMPPGWAPPELLSDPHFMAAAIAKGCITTIVSDVTTIAGGAAATQINVQPSEDCFFVIQRKIIAVSDADPQLRQRVLVGREFVGSCPVTCQTGPMFSDFVDTDDCAWCPTRNVAVGRTPNNKQYHVEITNLNAAVAIRVQVALRGICYPSMDCWTGWCRKAA